MSNDNKQENKELSKLININEDATEFYRSAQEKAESPSLKSTFKDLESLHKGVILNLQNIVRANGGETKADETMVGNTRQFFGELIAKVSNKPDAAIVTHLEEAEDRCLHSMQSALESSDVSTATKQVLLQEAGTLQKSHDYMKAMKEYLKQAA
tara:strand:- start:4 stop:465 length:462 start_codon:yes stop_codon:yes gene_type:complete